MKMSAEEKALRTIINEKILPGIMLVSLKPTPESVAMLAAIGLQESRFEFRRQLGNGPARGFWQFERGGGVVCVMRHDATREKAQTLCAALDVPFEAGKVWATLEHNDALAAGFARLLLLSDPKPLPALDDPQAAWDYYERNWRPGKPHRRTWDAYHARAVAAVS